MVCKVFKSWYKRQKIRDMTFKMTPNNLSYKLHAKPTFEELFIERGLEAYNAEYGLKPPTELAAFVTDDAGTVKGGVQGELQWNWLYIDLLWLDSSRRGNGDGAALMTSIEQAACAQGIPHVWLATTSFQSLPFYQHIGYSVLGQLDGRPPGHQYYFLHKRDLTSAAAPLPVTDDPDLGAVSTVRRGLTAYNAAQGIASDGKRLAIFLEDPHGGLHGGIIAATYWGWLDIQAMWVRPDLRGQGYGAALLAHAEAEARSRGCPHAFVDVASFQGLGFFQSQGYQTFGILTGRPPGYETHFMRKSLK